MASNHERLVSDRLADAGIECYYPYVTVRSRDGRRDVEKKFFPGYVFGRLNLAERSPIFIPQVVRILGFGNEPTPIPEPEIEACRTMITAAPASTVVEPCPYLATGERVRIISGPLRGLVGFVVFAKPGTARVVVSVTMLQRSISAEVDIRAVVMEEERAA